jgi:DNA processing protein
LLDGRPIPLSAEQRRLARETAARVDDDALDRAAATIDEATRQGARLVTVLDDGYPVNLRQVYNCPPFLWFRGELTPADRRAVALVGTDPSTAWRPYRRPEVGRVSIHCGRS